MDKFNEIGFTDWNKKCLEELVQHLEREFAFSSSGTAKAIFTLIEYYHKTKHLHKPVVSGKRTDCPKCGMPSHPVLGYMCASDQCPGKAACASGAVDKTVSVECVTASAEGLY